MTIPNPDSPKITENIGTMITNLAENMSYLDYALEGVRSNVQLITRDMSVTETITYNIGFTPTALIILATDPSTGASSWGFSDSLGNDYCTFIEHDGDSSASTAYSVYLRIGAANSFFSEVRTYKDNAVEFQWQNGNGSGTAYIIVLALG